MKKLLAVLVVALGLLGMNACHNSEQPTFDVWYLDANDCGYMGATIKLNSNPNWGGWPSNYTIAHNRFYYPSACEVTHSHGPGTIGVRARFYRASGQVCDLGEGVYWNPSATDRIDYVMSPNDPEDPPCNTGSGNQGYFANTQVWFVETGTFSDQINSIVDYRCDWGCA